MKLLAFVQALGQLIFCFCPILIVELALEFDLIKEHTAIYTCSRVHGMSYIKYYTKWGKVLKKDTICNGTLDAHKAMSS